MTLKGKRIRAVCIAVLTISAIAGCGVAAANSKQVSNEGRVYVRRAEVLSSSDYGNTFFMTKDGNVWEFKAENAANASKHYEVMFNDNGTADISDDIITGFWALD